MTTEGDTPRRRGRRSGGEDTRSALIEAAREVFAEQGYQGATVRSIASRAGVDAAMVNHWFGGKQALFAAVIELPVNPDDVGSWLATSDPSELARRLVRMFVTLWDNHEGRFAMLVLSVATQEVAAKMIGEFFRNLIFTRIKTLARQDEPELRAALCGTQMVGLGMMRYVLKLEPIASAGVESLVSMIAPTLQRYLTADL